MRKCNLIGSALAGLGAGIVTGLFGGGGGMILVPLLTAMTDLKDQEVFSASVSIILPICLVSLGITALQGTLAWNTALPYLFGSAAGGLLSGKWGQKIPTIWLHRGLGALILWGGYRYLC